MTSANSFCKLLWEDVKRRAWAAALLVMIFFFALPVHLSLILENAENTRYYQYNNWEPLVLDGTISQAEYEARVLACKTEAVAGELQFGNGLTAFLMIAAAVVVGAASFSYLHNRRKTDFYHSIPVRREMLFGAAFAGGILLVAAAYLLNLCLAAAVAGSAGVGIGSLAGPMVRGYFLNLLYFGLNYAVVTAAMMLTGHMVVGILATGVLFFFLPCVMVVLESYCNTFFTTATGSSWGSMRLIFDVGERYLSPVAAYVTAIGWESAGEGGAHIAEQIIALFAFLALTLFCLQLYRLRPSEAAGRAMAFPKTMAPIRILLVLGFGLAGGLFFWGLQSRLKWGLFGAAMGAALSHCVIEIIYHFDFKKLFSHKLQMVLSFAAVFLLFASFRYDWYGYDSYLPDREKVASASLDLNMDSRWISGEAAVETDSRGRTMIRYGNRDETIETMEVTNLDAVMILAEEGRKRALEDRDATLERWNTAAEAEASAAAGDVWVQTQDAASVGVIGGADGPTSIFLAGKTVDGGEAEETYFTQMTVGWHLEDGRYIRRTYQIPLSTVMDAYEALYDDPAYKEGLYYILKRQPSDYAQALYREAGRLRLRTEDAGDIEKLLAAYQQDLLELTAREKREQSPVGALGFASAEITEYLKENVYLADDYVNAMDSYIQSWPVYSSFERTMKVLEEMGAAPGSWMQPEKVREIRVDLESVFWNSEVGYTELPQGEELKALQAVNPWYDESGMLVFDEPQEISLILSAMVADEVCNMDSFKEIYTSVMADMKDGTSVPGAVMREKMSPEVLRLFAGIPIR